MSEKYFVGLDMGTSSVGWAVTDEHYHLLRRKGKDLWGARLFDEAKTSAARRVSRVSRRRLARQRARIGWLKELFRPYLDEKDPGFLQRLEESRFFLEDKTEKQPYALFSDNDFTDKDYYKKYPTIFHLRKELLESKDPHDVRLVFLAILNMYAHRGHFLNPELQEGTLGDIHDLLSRLDTYIQDIYEEQGWSILTNVDEQQRILAEKNISNSARLEKILAAIGVSSKDKEKKPLIEIYKLICGLKGTIAIAFSCLEMDEADAQIKISFSDTNLEEVEPEIERILGDKYFEMYSIMKEIHAWGLLSEIMSDDSGRTYEYISFAKVDSYKKHHEQLKLLKKVIRTYAPDEYHHMFRTIEDNTYSAYVGSVNSKNKKQRRGAKSTDFLKEVKRIIGKIEKEHGVLPECEEILNLIARDSFLPKQLSTANGVIPNQVYATELRRIVMNASEYLPFLKEKDETGLSNAEKIVEMFKFHIPYYIGPLKNDGSGTAWVVRKQQGTVYPWNIAEKVDMPKTRDQFILNLVRKCTYLNDEKVLPAASLLYEKYKVLNELNNLTIQGQKISVNLKQDIFRDLFRSTGKRVTTKRLISYLRKKAVIGADADENCLDGFDKAQGGFVNTLSSYHKFAEIFSVDVLTDKQREIAEEAIYYATIYGEDKAFLKKVLREKFSIEELSQKQIDRISGIRFRDWSRLSREFLLLEEADHTTGEVMTIIDRLWNTNENLMQIIYSDEYTYKQAIEERTAKIEKDLTKITFEDIEDSYISAPVRRMVWQTIRILQEIEEVMGSEPTRVFVEMTRSEGEKGDKGRKNSRKKKLMELYKKCKDDDQSLLSDIESRDERDFRIRKLYLYYRQKGLCLYSGHPIDFEKLFDDSYYDIDHIYPRHYIKDDSIENNLVLVESKLNRDKTDRLLDADIQTRMLPLWEMLHRQGFMNDEKFKRLTRKNPFTEEEFAHFIERQLVETGQGTKEVARILNDVLGNTDENNKVIYVKAGNVSAFRNDNKKNPEFVKCRVINDHHHAKDAYLNIVVGNTYYTKFTLHPANFIRELRNKSHPTLEDQYNMDKLFARRVERNGYTAWNPDTDFQTVKQVLRKNSVLISRRSFIEHGQIADLQLVSGRKISEVNGKGYLPIKASDIRLSGPSGTMKYGGYNKASGAYFFLVEHELKGKLVRTIEPVYVYMMASIHGKEDLEKYCQEELGYIHPRICLKKIPMYSHIRINGFDYYLTGRSNDRLFICNAVQLTLSSEWSAYIKALSKAVDEKWDAAYIEQQASRIQDSLKSEEVFISKERNDQLYKVLLQKHLEGFFNNRINSIGTIMKEGYDSFRALPVNEQAETLMEILKISQLVNIGANLVSIGGKSRSGVATVSKKISDSKSFQLISDSVTGIFQRATDLLTI